MHAPNKKGLGCKASQIVPCWQLQAYLKMKMAAQRKQKELCATTSQPRVFPGPISMIGSTVSYTPEDGTTVSVTPQGSMTTTLMNLIGIDDLEIATPAVAKVANGTGWGSERKKLEIVLVLDISGSMGRRTSNGLTRLDNLKYAASSLVEDVMRNRAVGDVAFSIAPYESWVMVDNKLLNEMTNTNGSENCADFEDWNEMKEFRGQWKCEVCTKSWVGTCQCCTQRKGISRATRGLRVFDGVSWISQARNVDDQRR